MAEQIISASGTQFGLIVSPEGRALVDISGATINIGSVSANVDSIYIQSGNNIVGSFVDLQTSPIDVTKNNPAWKFEYIISGTSTGAIGSSIGSITQFIGAGSFVSVATYSAGLITSIGSYE